MKKKEYRLANALIIGLVLFFATLTIMLSSNTSLKDFFKQFTASNSNSDSTDRDLLIGRCSDKQPLEVASTDPYSIKLQAYQNACRSFVTDQMMIFTIFPQDSEAAQDLANQVADTLISFRRSKIKPIVVVEPYVRDEAMSYRRYINGEYDQFVGEFFRILKDRGLSDENMGTWVPFPESNTPSWDNKDTEPRDFSTVVNKYLRAMRVSFPEAKGSILLNATTYEPNDLEYENGDYISLLSYAQNIDKDLIDSVGIQGFPWVSRANQARREIFRASEFLQPDYAIELAKELRTRNIWFNTGTFLSKYTNNPEQKVTISSNDRKAILNGILEEANKVRLLQQNEYRVSINIFAEDKSDTKEATDWSYLSDPSSQKILEDFLRSANENEVGISFYDKSK